MPVPKIVFSPEDKKKINTLVSQRKFVLFEVSKGKLWLVTDHHRYLDYARANRKLICRVKVPASFKLMKGRYWYVNEKL